MKAYSTVKQVLFPAKKKEIQHKKKRVNTSGLGQTTSDSLASVGILGSLPAPGQRDHRGKRDRCVLESATIVPSDFNSEEKSLSVLMSCAQQPHQSLQSVLMDLSLNKQTAVVTDEEKNRGGRRQQQNKTILESLSCDSIVARKDSAQGSDTLGHLGRTIRKTAKQATSSLENICVTETSRHENQTVTKREDTTEARANKEVKQQSINGGLASFFDKSTKEDMSKKSGDGGLIGFFDKTKKPNPSTTSGEGEPIEFVNIPVKENIGKTPIEGGLVGLFNKPAQEKTVKESTDDGLVGFFNKPNDDKAGPANTKNPKLTQTVYDTKNDDQNPRMEYETIAQEEKMKLSTIVLGSFNSHRPAKSSKQTQPKQKPTQQRKKTLSSINLLSLADLVYSDLTPLREIIPDVSDFQNYSDCNDENPPESNRRPKHVDISGKAQREQPPRKSVEAIACNKMNGSGQLRNNTEVSFPVHPKISSPRDKPLDKQEKQEATKMRTSTGGIDATVSTTPVNKSEKNKREQIPTTGTSGRWNIEIQSELSEFWKPPTNKKRPHKRVKKWNPAGQGSDDEVSPTSNLGGRSSLGGSRRESVSSSCSEPSHIRSDLSDFWKPPTTTMRTRKPIKRWNPAGEGSEEVHSPASTTSSVSSGGSKRKSPWIESAVNIKASKTKNKRQRKARKEESKTKSSTASINTHNKVQTVKKEQQHVSFKGKAALAKPSLESGSGKYPISLLDSDDEPEGENDNMDLDDNARKYPISLLESDDEVETGARYNGDDDDTVVWLKTLPRKYAELAGGARPKRKRREEVKFETNDDDDGVRQNERQLKTHYRLGSIDSPRANPSLASNQNKKLPPLCYDLVEEVVGNDLMMAGGSFADLQYKSLADAREHISNGPWSDICARKTLLVERKPSTASYVEGIAAAVGNSYLRMVNHLPPIIKPLQEQKAAPKEVASRQVNNVTLKTVLLDEKSGDATQSDQWSEDDLRSLQKAVGAVDAHSRAFWADVAEKVEGKGEAACRSKWFSQNSPQKRKKEKKLKVEIPDDDRQDDGDDLFDSTPVKGSLAWRDCQFHGKPAAKFLGTIGSPITYGNTSKLGSEDDTLDLPDLRQRRKVTYIRDLGKQKRTQQNVKKRKEKSKKSAKIVTGKVDDGDIELKGQLSPGGTLKLQEFGGESEDDYFMQGDEDSESGGES